MAPKVFRQDSGENPVLPHPSPLFWASFNKHLLSTFCLPSSKRDDAIPAPRGRAPEQARRITKMSPQVGPVFTKLGSWDLGSLIDSGYTSL